MSEHAEAHRRLADVVDALEAMGASVGEASVNRARDGDVYVDLTADLSDGVDVPVVEEIDAGEELAELRQECDRLQAHREQLVDTINAQAETIEELRGTRDHDVDDRAATIRVTVDGEEHTDVIRECEQSRGLPDGVSVYLERVEAHDADDDLRGTLDERNEQLDEARRRAQEAEQRVEALEDTGGCGAEDDLPGTEELFGTVGIPEDADDDPDDDPDDSAPDLPADLDDPPRALAEAMAELGESRVDDLAGHLDVSGGTVHGRLSALRDHDLVDARPAPDSGRAKLYSLATGDGEDEADAEDPEQEPTEEDTPEDADQPDQLGVVAWNDLTPAERVLLDALDGAGAVTVPEAVDGAAIAENTARNYLRTFGEMGLVEANDPGGNEPWEYRLAVGLEDALESGEPVPEDLSPNGGRPADEADDDPDPADYEIPAECDWLELPADVIVEGARTARDLEEVLDVVERADGWLQVHKRIAGGTASATKDLLWELGLRTQSGALLDEEPLAERIGALREHYVGEAVAADGGDGT